MDRPWGRSVVLQIADSVANERSGVLGVVLTLLDPPFDLQGQ